MNIQLKEIGSEFSDNSFNIGENEYFDLVPMEKRFVLSGRTALHLVCLELKLKSISSIALPNYLCGTMITPFYDEGFTISFYDIDHLDDFTQIKKSSSVLIMDYFGFLKKETLEFAKQCKTLGKIIVVDATQTAFSNSKIYEISDYLVVSYRKWFDCLSAVVYSKCGFLVSEYQDIFVEYLKVWRQASKKKIMYLYNGSGDKKEFLSLYSRANSMLKDYKFYNTNEEELKRLQSCNSKILIKRRKENATYLIDGIKRINALNVELIFEKVDKEDCPLFVPIRIKYRRNTIQKELIKKGIYCPIHWPIDSRYRYKPNVLYEQELSLICDQRYSLEDMQLQLKYLDNILKKNS